MTEKNNLHLINGCKGIHLTEHKVFPSIFFLQTSNDREGINNCDHVFIFKLCTSQLILFTSYIKYMMDLEGFSYVKYS